MAATSRLDDEPVAGPLGDWEPRDLLLRAAFAPDDVAVECWRLLATGFDVDTLPYDLHPLLPLVATRLRERHIDHAELPRFDGIRKRLWSQNVLRARDVAAVCATLSAHRIDPLLTGGLAVLAHTADWGFRPLAEVDVAVAHDDQERALAALSDDGWRVQLVRRDGFLLDMRATVLARGDAGGGTGQLSSSHVTVRCSRAGWPHDGLASADVLDVVGNALPVASRADLLTFLVSDAERLPGYTPARRLADALAVCGAPGQAAVDWADFLRRVTARKAAPEATEFLAYLRGRLCCPIPASVLDRLTAHAGGQLGRLARRLDSSVIDSYRRRCRGGAALANVRLLPGYLREVWDVDTLAKLPSATVGHAKRTLARRLRVPN